MGTPLRVSTPSIRNTDRTGSDVVICDQLPPPPDSQILKMVTVLLHVKRVRTTDAILHTIVTGRTRVLTEEKVERIGARLGTCLKEMVAGVLRSKQTCLRHQYRLLKDSYV